MHEESKPTLAVIGGTGNLGHALARRWSQAGYPVVIGSRAADKAAASAAALQAETGHSVTGTGNAEAAGHGDIIIIAVPFATQSAILAEIRAAAAGKIVVETTVPLVPPKVMRVQLPAEGCAALRAQEILGPEVTVISAFHNVAAHKLATDETVDCDVLVFGEKRDARATVIELVTAAGLHGLHAGSLANSAAAEALTSILIFINKHYAVDGAGFRITGELVEP